MVGKAIFWQVELVLGISIIFIIMPMGDFAHGYESKSYIESLWSHLKNIIKNIYFMTPLEHFILYLKEAEFLLNVYGLDYHN